MIKTKLGTRLLSVLMALTMLLGLVPMTALAEEEPAEENTLKEGTYTVTANLYVPGSENVILTGVTAYLTNTKVPPVSPVEKNAKLVVDADGNMTLTIKNLNPVFTLQRIEDAEGLKISQRFIEEGKFGSCTSRINGLEFQLLEKKDVYSFPDCEEMPCLNDHMSMLSMPLELKIDYDSATEGYVEPGAANTKAFYNVYKGYDDALTYLDVVVSVPADYSDLLDSATLVATAVDESTFDGAQALKNMYIDPTPVMKFFELKLVDANGDEIILPEDGVSIAMNYGARTFYEEGLYQDIAAYVDGEWVDLNRVTTKNDLYAPEYMVTAEHLGVFAAVENGINGNHKYDLTAEYGDAHWDFHSVTMWGCKSLTWNILTNVNAKQTEIENVGTAYQFTQQAVGTGDADKDNTTLTLTLPHKEGMNYYLVAWNKKNLDQRKLSSIRVGDSDVISVVSPSTDKNTRDNYLPAIQRWMSNDVATGGTTESAFVLATTKKLAEVSLTETSNTLLISGTYYTGEEVTAPISIGNGQAAIEGNTATEKGTHTATITPQGEYIWADGTQDAKTIEWKVFAKSKTQVVPTFESASICYGGTFDGKIILKDSNGNPLDADAVLTPEGKAKLDLAAEIEALEKDESGNIPEGKYSFIIKFSSNTDLVDTDAYKISSTVTLTLNVYPVGFNIGTDKQMQKPAGTATKTWNGLEQCLVTSYSSGYKTDWTVSGQNWGKAPGKYTVTITPNENVWWDDGTRGAYTVDWYIKKTATAPTAVEGLTYNGKEQVGVPEGEGYTVVGGTATEAGTHTATVTLNDYYMWSDSALPETITVTYEIAAAADYTAVDAAIAKIPADLSGYTDDSVKALTDAKNAVVRDLSSDKQSEVDAMAKAIEDAVAGLVKKDSGDSSVTVVSTSVVTANLFVPGELNKQLPGVTAYMTNGNNPMGEGGYEKKAPTEPVSNNAVLTKYSDNTVTVTVPIPNPVFTLQKIDGGTNAKILSAARDSQTYSSADGSVSRNGRITSITVQLLDNSGTYVFSDCTEFPTILGVDWNVPLTLSVELPSDKPATKDADYTAVDAAIAKIPADLSGYTDDSVKALTDAKNAVVRGLTEDKQSEVDAMAKAIEDAIAALVKKADPEPTPAVKKFSDVPADSYCAKAVDWAVANGVTMGTTDTTFSPNAVCTRAQTVTLLWRAAGSPEPTLTKNPFTDVDSSSFCYKAVLWAYENGITAGTTATTFAPNATVTRAQAVTFMYRAAGSPKVSGSSVFTDVDSGSFCYDAVLWAAENGITAGTTATTFAPNAGCTRGQIVTFLYRQLAK